MGNRHVSRLLSRALAIGLAGGSIAAGVLPAGADAGAASRLTEAGIAANERYLPRLTLERLQQPLEAAGFGCQAIRQSRQQPLVWLCTRDSASAQEHVQIQGHDRSHLTFVNAAVMALPGAAPNPTRLFRLIASLPFQGEQAQQARAWVATATAKGRSSLRIGGVLLAFTRRSGVSYLSLAPT